MYIHIIKYVIDDLYTVAHLLRVISQQLQSPYNSHVPFLIYAFYFIMTLYTSTVSSPSLLQIGIVFLLGLLYVLI